MFVYISLHIYSYYIYYILRYTTFGDIISGNLNSNYNYIHTFILYAIFLHFIIHIYSRTYLDISTMIT